MQIARQDTISMEPRQMCQLSATCARSHNTALVGILLTTQTLPQWTASQAWQACSMGLSQKLLAWPFLDLAGTSSGYQTESFHTQPTPAW